MQQHKSDSHVKNQLAEKWPKLTQSEMNDILTHHDHLRTSLKKHYSMSDVNAKKEEESFFASIGK